MALQYGADHVIDPSQTDCQILLSDITEFTGFDKIIETSSNFSALNLALKSLSHGGTLVAFIYYSYYQKTQINMQAEYAYHLEKKKSISKSQ